jgi:phosphatidylinositol alpha-1,6-mannosyltransferase
MTPGPTFRRILFASTGFDIGGGIASVDRSILRALQEEVEAGRLESVDLLSLHDSADASVACSGEFRTARGNQWRFVLHALRFLLLRRPDLLILDHLGLGRAFQVPPLSFLKPRTALFIHGTEFWAVQGGPRERVVRGADLILTNSEFTASTVRDRLPEVADRLRPVLLCIDPALVRRWTAAEPSAEIEREPAVLIVARMLRGEPGKGHDTLIDAWPRVRAAVPQARLWIVGDGSARPDFERRAGELGCEGIEFLGRISDRELSERYGRAWLFAMPSQQEGFGLVYAEAMWHGLPCIGSSADAAPEVIRDGESGAIVPYGSPDALADTIIALLRDPARREGMGRAARIDATKRFAFARFRADLLDALSTTKDASRPDGGSFETERERSEGFAEH